MGTRTRNFPVLPYRPLLRAFMRGPEFRVLLHVHVNRALEGTVSAIQYMYSNTIMNAHSNARDAIRARRRTHSARRGMDAVLENPLGSDEAGDSADDHDGIEDLESVPLLARRVSELEAQLAKHEVVLDSAGGGFGQSAIRAVLAHLGKSPANWYASVHHPSAQPLNGRS